MDNWTRIPEPVPTEDDRRALCAILASLGLEVRVIKARVGTSKSAPHKRFVEFRQQA